MYSLHEYNGKNPLGIRQLKTSYVSIKWQHSV